MGNFKADLGGNRRYAVTLRIWHSGKRPRTCQQCFLNVLDMEELNKRIKAWAEQQNIHMYDIVSVDEPKMKMYRVHDSNGASHGIVEGYNQYDAIMQTLRFKTIDRKIADGWTVEEVD